MGRVPQYCPTWPTYIAQNIEYVYASPGILCLILSDIQDHYQYNFPVLNYFEFFFYHFWQFWQLLALVPIDIESDIVKENDKSMQRFISQHLVNSFQIFVNFNMLDKKEWPWTALTILAIFKLTFKKLHFPLKTSMSFSNRTLRV